MMKMITHESVSVDLQRERRNKNKKSLSAVNVIFITFLEIPQVVLRGLPKPHGVVTFAHDLFASTVHELSEPPDAAHEEAGVDVEQDYRWVAVGIFPIGKKRRL